MSLPMPATRERIVTNLGQVPGEGPLNGDFRVGGWQDDKADTRPAAVLVPLVERPDGFTVLLTQRTSHLHHHPGQVSFPGGRMEQGDRDAVATALRETEEEIGLEPDFVEIAGYLDPYRTVTGFLVTPVVAFVSTGFVLAPDTFEVASVFEVPLSYVLDPSRRELRSREFQGRQRQFYVMHYQDYCIWGATAAMLVNLHDKLLRLPQESDEVE